MLDTKAVGLDALCWWSRTPLAAIPAESSLGCHRGSQRAPSNAYLRQVARRASTGALRALARGTLAQEHPAVSTIALSPLNRALKRVPFHSLLGHYTLTPFRGCCGLCICSVDWREHRPKEIPARASAGRVRGIHRGRTETIQGWVRPVSGSKPDVKDPMPISPAAETRITARFFTRTLSESCMAPWTASFPPTLVSPPTPTPP
jgi:hypothetical protein